MRALLSALVLVAGCAQGTAASPCDHANCTDAGVPDGTIPVDSSAVDGTVNADGTTSCPQGFADCNGSPGDGCEADLTSPATCGDCDTTCVPPSNGNALCINGGCDFECQNNTVRCGEECLDRCTASFDTPGESDYVVPVACVRLQIVAWGAGGGNGSANTNAGAGGFASSITTVTPGETLRIVVGAGGGHAPGSGPGVGGAPGGGNGGSSNSQGGGGGGGYSGVFRGALTPVDALVIAGGGAGSGGGSGWQVVAGAGGGTAGQDGSATGGTQTTGYAQLLGGDGGSQGSGDGGGGGGGGWYGGFGGGGANSDAFGGGGGSGYSISTAESIVLTTGDYGTPGNASHPERGGAGEVGSAGKVIVDCVP